MQVAVYRLLDQGRKLEAQAVRARRPDRGELLLRVRLSGRGDGWDVHLAALLAPDWSYVIPCLDGARVTAVKGRWMLIEGREVRPHGSSFKRLAASHYAQQWWCRIEGASAAGMSEQPRQRVGMQPSARRRDTPH